MKEKNKIYTAADFARYHAGTMPAGEMQALEKAALEDPFLEDALEGYVHAPAFESDIEELQARLAEKRKKKNVFFLSSFAQNKWWRIAALFIVIAGAGYLFYQVNYIIKENPIAKNEIKTSTEKKDNAPVKADSATIKNDVAFENPQSAKFAQKEKAPLPAAKPQIEKEVVSPVQKVPVPGLISPGKPKDDFSNSISPGNPNKENDVQVTTQYLLKGKVTDETGNAVPYASITDKSRNKVAITDTAGNFFLPSEDSSIKATASATGYRSKSFTLKKDAQPIIAMNKADAELSDVVVTGYSSKRKQIKKPASASKALNGKVAGTQVVSALPQPSGGQEKFDQYLKENTEPIYDENNERLTGEVMLSFTINEKGRPKNIKVLKSSCEVCEQEAIKLLQNGPDWIGKKDTQGTVVIKF